MHTLTINIQDRAFDKVLDLLKNLSDIEIIESKSEKTQAQQDDERWIYWKDAELDNFGKIAVGLSFHDYDDEDYSKW